MRVISKRSPNLAAILLLISLCACLRPAGSQEEPWLLFSDSSTPTPFTPPLPGTPFPTELPLASDFASPTPDPVRSLPSLREDSDVYVVQPGDTLLQIARLYNLTVEQIVAHNQLDNPDLLEVGQVLEIPAPAPVEMGPGFKVIPDSELVNGPSAVDFDLQAFVAGKGGFLSTHREDVEGEELAGYQVVRRIAQNYSVHPRILLAVLEHQSGWVTNPNPSEKVYPAGLEDPRRDSLYRQLAWAADNLNYGYYLWRVDALPAWSLADGALVPVNPTINAGTAGVQFFFSRLLGLDAWRSAVDKDGFFLTYNRLFGYPFAFAVEPLLPPALEQPQFQLPFETGNTWRFTGGPHGGWDNGSGWAALDFAPPGDALGCVQSEAWATAVAPGLVVRTGNGQVLLDLDEDGYEQTGWVVLYMHIETRDRVQPGTSLEAGERIGHPSCEGGFSTGTHLHIARKYNGEWIPADQAVAPFILDGWVAAGSGSLYDGWLFKGNLSIEADNGLSEKNEISR